MKGLLFLGAALSAVLLADSPSHAQANQRQTTPPARQSTVGPNYVDNDGDGICDRWTARHNNQVRRGRGPGGRGGYGPGDGTGNQGVGPQDGSGYGPGPGTNCDGTGPKGRGRRGGRR